MFWRGFNMTLGKINWASYNRGIEKEWLVTNGMGGYASSTIICANTRRYHGLLVASMNPPVQRHLIISKIDESILMADGKIYNIHTFSTKDYVMDGFNYMQSFKKDIIPIFTYNVKDIFIEKKVCMVYGKNTTIITYKINNGRNMMVFRLFPLVNSRDHHYESSKWNLKFKSKRLSNGVLLNPENTNINISIYSSCGIYNELIDCWFNNMYYEKEEERGLNAYEDHYIPGNFEVEVKPYEQKIVTIVCTVEDELIEPDGLKYIKLEKNRVDKIVRNSGYKDKFLQKLVIAADSFIINRQSTKSKSVIAGYHWFTDWGRDAMISLAGTTLVTKRYKDGRNILETFSKYINNGLIPNMFPDISNSNIMYNSVDASLWYFEAVYKYLVYTGDYEFIKNDIFKSLESIIEAFINGTNYNIKMEEDYLINADSSEVPLTWMDAKIGDWIVTPRNGKTVEINALWFNALNIMFYITKYLKIDGTKYLKLANNVLASFVEKFWNADYGCLYDYIQGDYYDNKIRPNQILAMSLSFPIVNKKIGRSIIGVVWDKLYTPYGLRTLSPDDEDYEGCYCGGWHKRDGAYHQGTVWVWLLGHFITSIIRFSDNKIWAKKVAKKMIEPLKYHLDDVCIGSISEIFDGDEPFIARGSISQAWSVAEILRTCIEDIGMN